MKMNIKHDHRDGKKRNYRITKDDEITLETRMQKSKVMRENI